ncbi:MAG: 2-oxoglutarate dehydrogenase complex dihydrolipoyllysine-residue succinyltransferase [Acidobacteria bacterium]|nr:2-oxoglutarate dehydrogenase complex dihydrolipoyllysine-residue succinyltransferase [Acidobacteriota bacterium]
MKHEIRVPSVGESVSEVRIARWLKQDGESVQMDEPILELETDKANMELNAESPGILKTKAAAGQTVVAEEVIGTIEPETPSVAEARPEATAEGQEAAGQGETPTRAGEGQGVSDRIRAKQPSPSRPPAPASAEETGEEQVAEGASPAVRRLLREHDLDASDVAGTGKGGRVRKEDVLNFVQARKAEAAAAKTPSRPAGAPSPRAAIAPKAAREPEMEKRERVVPMSLLRQKIAERMLQAQQTAAILTTFNEADMSAVMDLRARHKEAFQQKHGVSLGLMSFFVKAAVEALRAIPVVNAAVDGQNIVYRNYYDIGVAVATDRGLVVPVLRNADKMDFPEIETAIASLANKARQGSLTVDDLTGGTFTITNGGVFGSLLSTPILNPPQSGILGMHTIQKRPVVVDNQITIRPMMYVALSYDHRIVDGKEAVTFLLQIKQCIEDPLRLVLGV